MLGSHRDIVQRVVEIGGDLADLRIVVVGNDRICLADQATEVVISIIGAVAIGFDLRADFAKAVILVKDDRAARVAVGYEAVGIKNADRIIADQRDAASVAVVDKARDAVIERLALHRDRVGRWHRAQTSGITPFLKHIAVGVAYPTGQEDLLIDLSNFTAKTIVIMEDGSTIGVDFADQVATRIINIFANDRRCLRRVNAVQISTGKDIGDGRFYQPVRPVKLEQRFAIWAGLWRQRTVSRLNHRVCENLLANDIAIVVKTPDHQRADWVDLGDFAVVIVEIGARHRTGCIGRADQITAQVIDIIVLRNRAAFECGTMFSSQAIKLVIFKTGYPRFGKAGGLGLNPQITAIVIDIGVFDIARRCQTALIVIPGIDRFVEQQAALVIAVTRHAAQFVCENDAIAKGVEFVNLHMPGDEIADGVGAFGIVHDDDPVEPVAHEAGGRVLGIAVHILGRRNRRQHGNVADGCSARVKTRDR